LLEEARGIKGVWKNGCLMYASSRDEGLSAPCRSLLINRLVRKIKEKPERIFIIHGEKEGAETLKGIIETYWDSEIQNFIIV
jgi:metallo-beta-lactamase family protein